MRRWSGRTWSPSSPRRAGSPWVGTDRCRFVIVGPTDDDKSDAIAPDTFEAARRDGVVFTGQRTDMPECYAASDVFVTASWREGFPRSAMEAAAMGLPTVGTDIRGNRQVVADGETGSPSHEWLKNLAT